MEIQAETLALLEWARLGEHLSGFAGSPLGQALCRRLPLAPSAAEASRRLEETSELLALDGLTDGGLSFLLLSVQCGPHLRIVKGLTIVSHGKLARFRRH